MDYLAGFLSRYWIIHQQSIMIYHHHQPWVWLLSHRDGRSRRLYKKPQPSRQSNSFYSNPSWINQDPVSTGLITHCNSLDQTASIHPAPTMHFLSIAVLASLTTAISATPTPPANESLEFRTPVDSVNTGTETKLTKRDVVHFYVCTDEDFGGTCENLSTNTGVCCQCQTRDPALLVE